ncbi:MAG: hypothetical protein SNI57_06760, partial [Rikenellaceae bacterium]
MKHKYIFLVAALTFAATLPTTASGERLSWKERREIIKSSRESTTSNAGSKVVINPTQRPVAIADTVNVIKIEASDDKRTKVDTAAYNSSLTIDYSVYQVDSLLSKWREQAAMDQFIAFFDNFIMVDEVLDDVDVKSIPDSILSRRLMDLVSPINLPYNSIVKSYISRYINPKYGTIGRIMS